MGEGPQDQPIRSLGTPHDDRQPEAVARPTDEVDPNLGLGIDDETLAAGTTQLDALEDELGAEVEGDDFYVPVPRRPGYELRFKSHLDGELMGKWARSAADRKALGGIDELKLSKLVLTNLNTGIVRNGDLVTVDGVPMTIRSRGFLDVMKEGRPFDAVKKLYGSDGHLMAAAREVLSECGYGEDLVAAAKDPTPRS